MMCYQGIEGLLSKYLLIIELRFDAIFVV